MDIVKHALNTIEEQLNIIDLYTEENEHIDWFTDDVQARLTKFREKYFPEEFT